VKLWTLQPVSRLVDLERDQIIRGSEEHGMFFKDLPHAYPWMVAQMTKRLPAFSGEFPVWAWTKRKDLRLARWECDVGSWHVQIGFEAPADKVLLSNFDLWHCVLNNSPATLSESEWDRWHQRWDARLSRKGILQMIKEASERGVSPPDLANELERAYEESLRATWDRIFDLSPEGDSEWLGEVPPVVQACVDGLRAPWVTSVELFQGARKD